MQVGSVLTMERLIGVAIRLPTEDAVEVRVSGVWSRVAATLVHQTASSRMTAIGVMTESQGVTELVPHHGLPQRTSKAIVNIDDHG